MIIGIALKEVFKGKTINVNGHEYNVQFHFGDQKELLKWTIANYKKQKYPLIWYVVSNVENLSDNGFRVDTQLIIFNLTKGEYFNTDRYENVYLKWIDPTYKLVNELLRKNQFINVLNNGKKLDYQDQPNFGIDNNTDFENNTNTTNKGITTDIVDARVMRLKMDIYPNCIIK